MEITKKNLGIILLIISLMIGIYGMMLFTGAKGQFYTWEPPFTKYEIKTFVFIGVGIIGSLGGLNLIGSGSKK